MSSIPQSCNLLGPYLVFCKFVFHFGPFASTQLVFQMHREIRKQEDRQ